MQFMQQGQNRQLSAIDRILGQGAGAPAEQPWWERFLGGAAGGLTGQGSSEIYRSIGEGFK